MQIIGTFQSRDAADAVKDAFIAEGFAPDNLIVMANRQQPEPPEDADLETGTHGEGGFAGIEEKVGKIILKAMGKKDHLDGDATEGDANGGALLGVTVSHATPELEQRVRLLLERHHAADIEVAQAD